MDRRALTDGQALPASHSRMRRMQRIAGRKRSRRRQASLYWLEAFEDRAMVGTLLVFSPFFPTGAEGVPRAFADSGEGPARANGGPGKLTSGNQRLVHDGLFPSDRLFGRPIGRFAPASMARARRFSRPGSARSPVQGLPRAQPAVKAEGNRGASAAGGAKGTSPLAPGMGKLRLRPDEPESVPRRSRPQCLCQDERRQMMEAR